MIEKEDKKSSELSISTAGVTIKGELADSLAMPVKRASGTADSVLRFVNNVVSTPLDYFSHNLEAFRRRYAEKFEEIPHENRIEPPMRIGYAVLEKASRAAEDSDIQELFAQLLASASNMETVELVHPSFASVISELDSVDARVLRAIAMNTNPGNPIYMGPDSSELGASGGDILRSRANLMRLGLIERRDVAFSPQELQQLVGKQHYGSPRTVYEMERTYIDLVNDLQRLKNTLISKLRSLHERQDFYISTFGLHFIKVAMGR